MTRAAGSNPIMISVIIPTLNESHCIRRALDSVRGATEIIVADGGSTDATVSISTPMARVVHAQLGRGQQLNAGAAVANGCWLLFLHADAQLEPDALNQIQQLTDRKHIVGGCFQVRCLEPNAPRCVKLINRMCDWRSSAFGIIYGDQGMFVRTQVFRRIGGFAPIPLMEDLEFSQRLRNAGRTILLRSPIRVSSRRWLRHGPVRTLVGNWLHQLAYVRGADPHRLHQAYYE